jgi:hypothetical protein
MKNVNKARKAKAKKARAPRARTKERPVKSEEAVRSDDDPAEEGFLFEDPYWDDAFCSYYDPTLRTCCRT